MMFLTLTLILGVTFSTAFPAAEDDLPAYGIVGGQRVDIKSYPYQVSLMRGNRHMCGGAIISPQHVLTAAHCVHGQVATQLQIRAGSNTHLSGGQLIGVAQAIVHPSYNTVNFDNDIAILVLRNTIKYEAGVQPITLSKTTVPYGKMAAVSGWGALNEGGSASPWLMMVGANVFPRAQCQNIYGVKLTNNMFCAGYMTAGKDSCQGDSGGPLAYSNTLIGVVSWGYGCARAGLPGVYTDVSKYISWVQRYVAV